MPDLTRQEFLNDLCPRVRPIIVDIMNCGCGCEALDLFQNRPRTWNEMADIAYYLQQTTATSFRRFAERNNQTYGLARNQHHAELNYTGSLTDLRDDVSEEVVQTLDLLLDLGVIQRREIFGMSFYRLTEDAEILHALDQYQTWREVLRSRWQQTQVALRL